jgi:hypothetical protein
MQRDRTWLALSHFKAYRAWQGRETVNIPGVAWLVALR